MLSSLISGTRDVRAPLAVGLTLAAACWFFFGPDFPIETSASGFAAFLYRTTAMLGRTGSIAVGVFCAYILGSILIRVSQGVSRRVEARLQTLVGHLHEWLQRHTRLPYRERALGLLGNYMNGLTALQNPGRRGRGEVALGDALDPIIEERLRAAPLELLRSMSREAQADYFEAFGNSGNVDSMSADDMRQGLRAVLIYRVYSEYAGLTTRLQIRNKELYDDYDRVKTEGDLRVALAFPVAIFAFALAWRWSPWFGLTALAAPVLWVFGHELRVRSETILGQALIEGVMTPPTLDRLADDIQRARSD